MIMVNSFWHVFDRFKVIVRDDLLTINMQKIKLILPHTMYRTESFSSKSHWKPCCDVFFGFLNIVSIDNKWAEKEGKSPGAF